MQVNAMGPLWLINAILPSMQKRGNGKIVLVSSVGGGISQFPGKPRHCTDLTCSALLLRGLASTADLLWLSHLAETKQSSITWLSELSQLLMALVNCFADRTRERGV